MKCAILSDIHANLDALRLVLDDADEQGVDQIVCLGDVVGYGPQPAEALTLIRSRATVILAGNHDDAVSGRADGSNFIDFAADAVKRHREALNEEQLTWLRALPYVCDLPGNAVAAHGDFVSPRQFRYIMETNDAAANFNAVSAQLMFVGHTHFPCLFLTGRSGTVYMTEPQDFTIEEGKRYIVNVGTVGYPRDVSGPAFSTYVIYDTNEKTVAFRQIPFSVSSVMPHGDKLPVKKSKRWPFVVATVACAAVLAVAVTVLALLSGGSRQSVGDIDAARVLDTKMLNIYDGQRIVRANIRLADDSSPAILKVVFHDEKGRNIPGETITVKRSSTKAMKIPSKAVRVSLIAMQPESSEAPEIVSFAPGVSVE